MKSRRQPKRKRTTFTIKFVGDDNHNDLIVDETEERLTITISRAADSIYFSLDNVTVRCGDPVPELTATSTSGTAVTFTYSDNGNDYYTKEQLGDFTFTYGTTYYVKAAVADSTNYIGAEKVLTITPQHNIKPDYKIHNRAFARTGRAHDRDTFARTHVKRKLRTTS